MMQEMKFRHIILYYIFILYYVTLYYIILLYIKMHINRFTF